MRSAIQGDLPMHQRLLSIALLSAVVLGLLFVTSPQSSAQTNDSGGGQPDQAVLTPGPAASLPGAGLMAPATNSYLSPPTEAAHPFTHMLVRREASLPEGTGLTLFAR